MAVAESNHIYYVAVEQQAILRTIVAVKAETALDAETQVANGGGLVAGYLNHEALSGEQTVLYVDEEVPVGINPIDPMYL